MEAAASDSVDNVRAAMTIAGCLVSFWQQAVVGIQIRRWLTGFRSVGAFYS